MWKILVNDGMESEGVLALQSLGFKVDCNNIPQNELNEKLPFYDGIIVRSATKVRTELIDACPDLKFIARGGVGMDNIDVEYARQKGIEVINTPAASSRSVAELAMAHMLCCSRGLHISNRELQNKDSFASLKKQFASLCEIKSKTLFLIGFGRIGKELAKMAIGSEMKVVVYDPYISNPVVDFEFNGNQLSVSLPQVELADGFSIADYISIHTPFVGQPILTKSEFEQMKQGVIIINTSRGENINESDLLDAIEAGKVMFAGLDVYQDEPNISSNIISHRLISKSPHIGASTQEAQARIALELVEKIDNYYNSK